MFDRFWQECISMVSAAYDRAELWKNNEDFVIKLQAYSRMHIARSAYLKRKEFMNNQVRIINRLLMLNMFFSKILLFF